MTSAYFGFQRYPRDTNRIEERSVMVIYDHTAFKNFTKPKSICHCNNKTNSSFFQQ